MAVSSINKLSESLKIKIHDRRCKCISQNKHSLLSYVRDTFTRNFFPSDNFDSFVQLLCEKYFQKLILASIIKWLNICSCLNDGYINKHFSSL